MIREIKTDCLSSKAFIKRTQKDVIYAHEVYNITVTLRVDKNAHLKFQFKKKRLSHGVGFTADL